MCVIERSLISGVAVAAAAAVKRVQQILWQCRAGAPALMHTTQARTRQEREREKTGAHPLLTGPTEILTLSTASLQFAASSLSLLFIRRDPVTLFRPTTTTTTMKCARICKSGLALARAYLEANQPYSTRTHTHSYLLNFSFLCVRILNAYLG